jgi:HlyD family secretion protein
LKRVWKRFGWLAVVVALGGAGVGGWRIYEGSKSGAPQNHYETATVSRGPIVARVTATGTLSGRITVQVGSQVSGRIQALFADFNSTVTKGQVIAKIEPLLFEAEVARARANLVAARANFAAAQANAVGAQANQVASQATLTKAKVEAAQAVRNLDRAKVLAGQKLVAPADLEVAESASEGAKAQVDVVKGQVNVVRGQVDVARSQVAAAEGAVAQTRAALKLAQVNLDYTTIVSPIGGVVISRSVDVGQTVAASLQAPVLFTIAEDLRKMEVHTSVSEADVGKLRAEMLATFSVDAYPTEKFSGVVREIRNAPQVVQNVVTYDAVIDVNNADLKLKPGMTANVTFVYADRANVLQVANAALRFRPPPGMGRGEKSNHGGTEARRSEEKEKRGRRGEGGAVAGAGAGAGADAGAGTEVAGAHERRRGV